MKNLARLTLVALLASVHASAYGAIKSSYRVSDSGIKNDDGVYALYSYSATKPKLLKVAFKPIPVNYKDNEELIYIDGDALYPAYNSSGFKVGELTECNTLFFSVASHAGGRGYSPCRSNLTKTSSYEIAKNTFMTVILTGINAIFGGFFYKVEIDEEKFLKVTQDAQEISRIQQAIAAKLKEKNYLAYKNDYRSASSSNSIIEFINKYEASDPDGLVVRAKETLPSVLAKEAEQDLINRVNKLRAEVFKAEKNVTSSNVSGSIGKKVCFDTMLEYDAVKVPNAYGSVAELVAEPGQIFGTIDDVQISNGKIKLLIGGWGTSTARLRFNPSSLFVRGNGIIINPGTYAWTDMVGWWYC